MLGRLIHLCSILPPVRKVFWRQFYQVVTSKYKFDDWTCMNLGYTPLEGELKLDLEPSEEANRYGFQLYHFVCSAVDLKGKKVAEIGCGRGGGAYYVARQFQPESLVGVDFSSKCVDMARERYQLRGLSFATGDAEALTYPDNSFDAIINIESSHCYGNVDKFLSEARRILRPGGHLLFADFRDIEQVETLRQQFSRCGMSIVEQTDITPNVVRALDLDTDRKRKFFENLKDAKSFKRLEPLAGMRGSKVFEALETRQVIHRRVILQNTKAEFTRSAATA